MGKTMYPNIEAERIRYGMTKQDLARSLGISDNTLYNWERNGAFTLAAMLKLAGMFHCSLDYLVGRVEKVEEKKTMWC